MGALISKGVIAGAVVVCVGLLAGKGKSTAAALLIQIPVISLGALWAAATVNRENLSTVSGKMLITMPTWIAWVLVVYLLSRYSSLPIWALLAAGLLAWALGALIYIKLMGF